MNSTPRECWQCDHCGTIFVNRQQADDCCVNPGCYLPGCGRPRDGKNNSSYCCHDHQQQHWAIIEHSRLMKAEPVAWDGDSMLCCGEEWFADPESMAEVMWDDGSWGAVEDIPEWEYATRWVQLRVDLEDNLHYQCGAFSDYVEDLDDAIGLPLPDDLLERIKTLTTDLNQYFVEEKSGYWTTDYKHRIPLRELVGPSLQELLDAENSDDQ